MNYTPQNYNQNNSDPDSFKVIMIFLFILMVLLIGGFLIFYFLKSNQSDYEPLREDTVIITETPATEKKEEVNSTSEAPAAEKKESTSFTMSDFIRAIRAVENDPLLSASDYMNKLQREGFKLYRNVGTPRIYNDMEVYPYVLAKGCQPIDTYDDSYYSASPRNGNSIILEFLVSGDGTTVEMSVYTFNHKIGEVWGKQLQNLGYTVSSRAYFDTNLELELYKSGSPEIVVRAAGNNENIASATHYFQ